MAAKEIPTKVDQELSQIFHDFIFVANKRAYVKKYEPLIGSAKENSLSGIMCVRRYLEAHPGIPVCRALVFWRLLTQETTKLAKGELKNFKFKMPVVTTGRRLISATQATTYRKIDCQIMLFDYLLKIIPPKGENEKQAIAYAKFQFHAFTKYNAYKHFRVRSINSLVYNAESGCKFEFNLIPDSKDCVDHLGGVIRYHILRCISNDVRSLTLELPNDWNLYSSILATLLLQDASRVPKANRLTNRIQAYLKDAVKGNESIATYLHFEGQSELLEQMNKWCNSYNLIFEGDIPSSRTKISDDKMKLLCSRFVLEYMIKERTLPEVRQGLAEAAQTLWGHLLLEGCESFYMEADA